MPFWICRPLSAIALTVLLAVTASSCHKRQVAVPVPSEPAVVPTPAADPPQQQPTAPTEPATAPPPTTPAPTPPPPKDESKYQKNKAAEQSPPPKHAPRPSNPTPAQQGPAPDNTAPADAPRLGDILTPAQQHQYNAAIDLSLAHAQTSLGSITNRQLTKEQEGTVAEVRNFIQQALEKKRKDELGAAKSLAERADVLAHDLVASLR